MKFKAVLFFVFLSQALCAHSIAFVHLGKNLPPYLLVAIAQARLFNPECDLFLIAESGAAYPYSNQLRELKVTRVAPESLPRSSDHQRFSVTSKLDKRSLNGFWFYTTERFFYLEELIRQRGLTDVFHFESDVMLYADVSQFLPALHTHYANMIGATFEDDERCVPGFFYVPNQEPIEHLCKFFMEHARSGDTDMIMLGQFKTANHKRWIDDLPVLLPQYASRRSFQHLVADPARYSNCFEAFDSIFDAACIGQYLGGISPVHVGHSVPGYIDPYCCFWVSDFAFEWELDEMGRSVPFILFEGEKKRVNNLHIHCKDLGRFYSRK